MPDRARRKTTRSRKILISVLSVCTIIEWTLVISAIMNAPSDIQRKNNISLASQQTIMPESSTVSVGNGSEPTHAGLAASFGSITETVTPTVTPTFSPSAMPTSTPSPTPATKPTATITATQTPIPTSMPTSTPTSLKKGAKGDAVAKLQQRLADLGYLSGTPDGVYGDGTKAAVKNFQKNNSLTVDGVAGAATISALYSDTALYKPLETEAPEKQAVKSGSTSYVWITKTGEKYHRISNCGNTKNSKKVTLQDAKDMGYTRCKNCY